MRETIKYLKMREIQISRILFRVSPFDTYVFELSLQFKILEFAPEKIKMQMNHAEKWYILD